MVPVLQPCVLVLSRVLCLSPASQGDFEAHGDSGIASARGHERVVVVCMLRLSPAGLPSIPLAGTVSRQSRAGCPVRRFNPETCSSVAVEASMIHQSFYLSLQAMGYFESLWITLELCQCLWIFINSRSDFKKIKNQPGMPEVVWCTRSGIHSSHLQAGL